MDRPGQARITRLITPPRAGACLVGFSGGLDSTVLLHMLASDADARSAGLRAIHVHHGLHADADAWAAYETIYAASWKPEEGDPALLRAFAEAESARGTFRMGLARIEGRPVAAQFWTVEDGTAFIHKLAHVEDSVKASPGTLLSAALFRHVIEVDRVKRVDFGTGNDGYKKDWMNRHEPLWRLEAFNPARIAAWGPAMKAFARSKLGRE